MKYLKIISLAAVAAMALMAFASSASATELYKRTATGIETLKAGTTIEATLATGTSSNLTTTEGTVLNTCTTSSVKGTTANAGSATETVRGEVKKENLSWSNCTAGPVTTITGGELEIHWISGTTNGTLTAKNFEVTTETFLGKCTFVAGSATHLGTLTGATSSTTSATMDINAVVTRKVNDPDSGLCPSSAKWTGTYTVTSPLGLVVEEK